MQESKQVLKVITLAQNGKKSTKYTCALTLTMPRKPASENVFYLCHLLNILANFSNYFCIQAKSVDPDQIAPRGSHCLQK